MVDLSKIKEIARQKGMSLAEVAEKSNMTPQGLSRVMRTNVTNVQSVDLIAKALGVSPAVFFGVELPAEGTKDAQAGKSTTKKEKSLVSGQDRLYDLLQQQLNVMLDNNALLREYFAKK